VTKLQQEPGEDQHGLSAGRFSVKALAEGWTSNYRSIDNLLKKLFRKSKSEETRRTYLATIAKFCNYMGMSPDELINSNAECINNALQGYCDALDRMAYSRKYINNIIQVMKSFFKANGKEICVERYYLPARYRKRHEYVPTKSEVYEMADCAGSLRNRAIILFLFTTGLRVSTLCALTYGDVRDELEKGLTIIKVPVYPEMKRRVTGACKNNITYFTFASDEAVKALRLYINERVGKYGAIDPEDPLFSSETRLIVKHQRSKKFMTAREVQRLVKQAAKKAGLKNWMHITPHSLRKSYQSVLRGELIDGGRLDVKTQEFFMGHILSGSQENYFDWSKSEELRAEYARLNFARQTVENKFRVLELALQKAFEGTGLNWREVLLEYVSLNYEKNSSFSTITLPSGKGNFATQPSFR